MIACAAKQANFAAASKLAAGAIAIAILGESTWAPLRLELQLERRR
jgi:hypothetical protein